MKEITANQLLNPENDGVIKYIEYLTHGPGMVHPDVELRMKELNKNLDEMALRKYKNSMIIKCNKTSSIVVVAFGMAYSLRTGNMYKAAINAGIKTIHTWSDGSSLNLIESFGPDWVVGTWHKDEADWIASLNA